MITSCPTPSPECPYFTQRTPKALRGEQTHGCYADTDHIIPRFIGRQAMDRVVSSYIRSSANKQQLCRDEHDEKSLEDLKNPPPLPDRRFMINALIKARKKKRESML